MKFGYYLLNTYVPELDGDSRELYSHWMEQIDAAETCGSTASGSPSTTSASSAA